MIPVEVENKEKVKAREDTCEDLLSEPGNKKHKTKSVKTKGREFCPYCSMETVMIWVHGHYQCSKCKNVVTSCCD